MVLDEEMLTNRALYADIAFSYCWQTLLLNNSPRYQSRSLFSIGLPLEGDVLLQQLSQNGFMGCDFDARSAMVNDLTNGDSKTSFRRFS